MGAVGAGGPLAVYPYRPTSGTPPPAPPPLVPWADAPGVTAFLPELTQLKAVVSLLGLWKCGGCFGFVMTGGHLGI